VVVYCVGTRWIDRQKDKYISQLLGQELHQRLFIRKKINRSRAHTPTENNTPDTDTHTHTHDKNNTPNPQTNTSHKQLLFIRKQESESSRGWWRFTVWVEDR